MCEDFPNVFVGKKPEQTYAIVAAAYAQRDFNCVSYIDIQELAYPEELQKPENIILPHVSTHPIVIPKEASSEV